MNSLQSMRYWNGDEEDTGVHDPEEDDVEDPSPNVSQTTDPFESYVERHSTPGRRSASKGRPSFRKFADEQQKVMSAKV